MLTFTPDLVNIVIDGDSNMASSQLSNIPDKLWYQLQALSPLNEAITIKNLARGGATFETMLTGSDGSGIADVHAAFEPGKTNILPINGCLNPATQGKSSTAILADCKAYIDAAHAVHPEWRIFILTQPAGKDDGNTGYNIAIDEFNAYVRVNYAVLGAEGFIELRPPGGVFDYQPPYVYSETTFVKSQRYIDDVHWSPTGVQVVAGYIADKLAALPDVAPTAPAVLQKIVRLSAGKIRLRYGAP